MEYYNNYIQNFSEQEQEEFYINEEDFTDCEKCGLIQNWDCTYGEIYCKGDDLEENINCGDYDFVCSSCFDENSKTLKSRILITYYKLKGFIE